MKARTGAGLAALALVLAGGTVLALHERGDDARAREGTPTLPAAMIVAGDDLDGDDDDEEEYLVPLDRVPEHVLAAALEALPGLELEAAEAEREGGVLVYDLEGLFEGTEVEVEVSEDGVVLEIETGDDEDDGED